MISTVEILAAEPFILEQLSGVEKKELLNCYKLNNIFKDEYKDIYGTLGKMTLSYAASRTLDRMNDPIWLNYTNANDKAQLFSQKMLLSNEIILYRIWENVQRVLNK